LVVDSGTAYAFVYSLEVVLLLITLCAMYPLIAKKLHQSSTSFSTQGEKP